MSGAPLRLIRDDLRRTAGVAAGEVPVRSVPFREEMEARFRMFGVEGALESVRGEAGAEADGRKSIDWRREIGLGESLLESWPGEELGARSEREVRERVNSAEASWREETGGRRDEAIELTFSGRKTACR